MIGRIVGTAALLERFLDRSLLKYHCIIHQESLSGKKSYSMHVVIAVVSQVNKISARVLNRREFREYCGLSDRQHSHLVLRCGVRRLSNGQVLRRSWKLNNIAHDFQEEKDELPDKKLIL